MDRTYFKIGCRELYLDENGNLINTKEFPDRAYFKELASAIKYLDKEKKRLERNHKTEIVLGGSSYHYLMGLQTKYDNRNTDFGEECSCCIEEYILSQFEFDDDYFDSTI